MARMSPQVWAHGARPHLLLAQAALRQTPRARLLGRPHSERVERTNSVIGPPGKQAGRMLRHPHSQPEILLRGPLVPEPTGPGECREGVHDQLATPGIQQFAAQCLLATQPWASPTSPRTLWPLLSCENVPHTLARASAPTGGRGVFRDSPLKGAGQGQGTCSMSGDTLGRNSWGRGATVICWEEASNVTQHLTTLWPENHGAPASTC